ncbi:MAG: hypothetical protein KJN87_01415 [Desulfofustis sp.]|nr:hypothetical protein [Desulfofustis sp.]
MKHDLIRQYLKHCNKHSVHLNVRMAPQELWEIEAPRRPDSFLIVSLGAIFFLFALHTEFYELIYSIQQSYPSLLFGFTILFVAFMKTSRIILFY